MKKQNCSVQGCKADVAYMITDGSKCYRITFSKSLADYIAKEVDMKVERIELILTNELCDKASKSGLYAVCKKDSIWPLRITLFKELAELWTTDTTVIYECYIKRDEVSRRN